MHQVLGGKLQSEKEFCLAGLRERVIAKLAPPLSPLQLPSTILRKNTSPKGVNNCTVPKDI